MIRLKEAKNFYLPPWVGWFLLVACLAVFWAGSAWALGTSAGTPIINTATINYTLVADPTPRTSTASNSFDVMEVLDVVVTWQDAANVSVNSPHALAVTTFRVTNTGNGPEDFELLTNDILGGDDFDPTVQDIYLESNGTPGWQAGDTLYGGGGITFNADQGMTIYVRSDIPPSLANGDTGDLQFTARALTAGAAGSAAGTLLPGLGYNGVDAVVGTTNADGDAIGTYEVSAAAVALTKSVVQIVDPYGGNQPYTSAQVTYRIVVDVTGFGTAEALVITDAIPADMTYVNGSIVLDGTPQSDGADADNGEFIANTVTLNLGDTVAPATFTIEFATTIN